jgi:fatty acid elongase 2/fatty acid elongase 3
MGISIDRHFGVYLFDYFDQLYTLIARSSAKEFQFVQGSTPLSTFYEGKNRSCIYWLPSE